MLKAAANKLYLKRPAPLSFPPGHFYLASRFPSCMVHLMLAGADFPVVWYTLCWQVQISQLYGTLYAGRCRFHSCMVHLMLAGADFSAVWYTLCWQVQISQLYGTPYAGRCRFPSCMVHLMLAGADFPSCKVHVMLAGAALVVWTLSSCSCHIVLV